MILMQRLIRSLGVVEGVVIDTVDNYQGYENSIILLSLGMFSPSLSFAYFSLSWFFYDKISHSLLFNIFASCS